MSKFFSNFEKQIDAKGRVSVPAPFRAAVSELGGDRIYCFPSFVDQAIECYPPPAYMALLERIEGIVESPEAREQLELAVITRGVELTLDGEGRVSFPERILKSVGIEKAVTFAGRGDGMHRRDRRGVVDNSLEMLRQSHHLPQPVKHDVLELGRCG